MNVLKSTRWFYTERKHTKVLSISLFSTSSITITIKILRVEKHSFLLWRSKYGLAKLWMWVTFNSAPSFPLLFVRRWFHRQWRTFPELFLLGKGFHGKVSTGASVHTVGPQELTWVVFTWFIVKPKRSVQSTCSRTWMAMFRIPFSSIVYHCLAAIVEHLTRGEEGRSSISNSEIQCVVVCEYSHLGLFMKQVNSSSRDPTIFSHDTFELFRFSFTLFISKSCKVKYSDLQTYGLWVLEAYILSLFNRASSPPPPSHFLSECRVSYQFLNVLGPVWYSSCSLLKLCEYCVCVCTWFLTY